MKDYAVTLFWWRFRVTAFVVYDQERRKTHKFRGLLVENVRGGKCHRLKEYKWRELFYNDAKAEWE